jgi:hypothetical protein
MAHGGRRYRRLFREGGFSGKDGGDKAAPGPRRPWRRAFRAEPYRHAKREPPIRLVSPANGVIHRGLMPRGE